MTLGRRTKLGLGIGCGAVALIFLLVIGGGIFFARQMADQYRGVHDSEADLLAATGEVVAWRAPLRGVPTTERLDAFLAVRTDLSEWRTRLTGAVETFLASRRAGGSGPFHWWRLFRAGSDLAPVYAGFWTARNEALLARRMNPAEYIYLYVLAYYADLGRPPDDGYQQAAGGETSAAPEGAAVERQRMLAELRDVLLPILTTMPFLNPETPEPGDGLTAAEVGRELERLARAPERLPWQDGLPPALAPAFAPYRQRLAPLYSPLINPVELLFEAVTHTIDGADAS